MINPKTDKVCVTMPLRLKTAETNDAGSLIINKLQECWDALFLLNRLLFTPLALVLLLEKVRLSGTNFTNWHLKS